MINNAGIMPLAFLADHADAAEAWSRCIDINIKGVLNGMIAVHDQMMSQGRGHIVNISSIYGNGPVAGAAVYGATKAAVNTMSEAFRVETQGVITSRSARIDDSTRAMPARIEFTSCSATSSPIRLEARNQVSTKT